MRASSWPDMSPLARDRMSPMEKKLVRTTAVPASEASPRRERWETMVRTRAAATATTEAAGMIALIPQ